ncbi:MAG TPA: hypothetical protein DIT07_14105, partial [Sphingobacteriaceae bacterium]|nr:hypothetical protein [Sphingobacteriaceae bacterium]
WTNDQLKVIFDSQGAGGLKILKDLIAHDPVLKLSYHQVKICVQTSKFTFIPKEIYSDSDLDSYALFAYPALESDILVKEISSVKIKNITAIDKSLRKYLISNFNDPLIFNQVNPLIESSLKLYHNTINTTLILQFNTDSFEALVLKNNNLAYYNLFNTESVNEFNYFLLGIMRELQLKSTGTDVVISGETSESEDLYKCVQKYFSNIAFADCGILTRQATIFRGIPAHQFFSLISMNLCE